MSPFVLHILVITLLDLAGTLTAKFYSTGKNVWLLVATILLFGAAGGVFARSLKFEGVAITNVLWISLSVIVTTLFGYFWFKEDIAPIQRAGVGVILIGLILINLK